MKAYDDKCTGCGACRQKCPTKAIGMKDAELGVAYPILDRSKCIDCGVCDVICPIDQAVIPNQVQEVFAAVNINEETVLASTSGGVFSAVCEWIFSQNGVVYGCAFDGKLSPKQIRIDSLTELDRLRGSKYVQSSTENTFIEAEHDLEGGRLVLYSGTPCQIAGLRSFLGRDYANLICIDLVCHGVPSAKYFSDYLKNLENSEKMCIRTFSFRDKKLNGWALAGAYSGEKDKDGTQFIKPLYYFKSYYYSYFLSGEIYRKSCYSCKYAQISRIGDITLGDLWGAEGLALPFDVSNGCSLVLLNTEVALNIWKNLNIQSERITVAQAVKYNAQLKYPSKHNQNRQMRVEEYRTGDFVKINRLFTKANFRRNIIARLKYAVPRPVRDQLLKIRYRKTGA